MSCEKIVQDRSFDFSNDDYSMEEYQHHRRRFMSALPTMAQMLPPSVLGRQCDFEAATDGKAKMRHIPQGEGSSTDWANRTATWRNIIGYVFKYNSLDFNPPTDRILSIVKIFSMPRRRKASFHWPGIAWPICWPILLLSILTWFFFLVRTISWKGLRHSLIVFSLWNSSRHDDLISKSRTRPLGRNLIKLGSWKIQRKSNPRMEVVANFVYYRYFIDRTHSL